MGKAAIIASMNETSQAISTLNAKIAKLTEIKGSLESFPTTVNYVLINDENIKSNYDIAGAKYSKDTSFEQDLLKNIKRDFDTKIDNVSEKVSNKIHELESQKFGLENKMNLLLNQLLTTKEK